MVPSATSVSTCYRPHPNSCKNTNLFHCISTHHGLKGLSLSGLLCPIVFGVFQPICWWQPIYRQHALSAWSNHAAHTVTHRMWRSNTVVLRHCADRPVAVRSCTSRSTVCSGFSVIPANTSQPALAFGRSELLTAFVLVKYAAHHHLLMPLHLLCTIPDNTSAPVVVTEKSALLTAYIPLEHAVHHQLLVPLSLLMS